MKIRKSTPQTATSLDRAPRDDEALRVRNYLLTMGVRTLCLVLVVFVRPYGWYSFAFAAGAIVLPYIAVVIANAAQAGRVTHAQAPDDRQLPAPPAAASSSEAPRVIRIDPADGDDRKDDGERKDDG